MNLTKAQLTLATGETFSGYAPSFQIQPCYGEVVFNTGMVGYVESLTDPSYAGQILVFTYPLIGNYGVPAANQWESPLIHVKGVVMSELACHYSNHTAVHSLVDWLASQKIPYIIDVDTRAVTTCLRSHGVAPGVISQQPGPYHFEEFGNVHWVKEVSIKEPQYYGSHDKLIIVVDCGIKENILRCLLHYPLKIKRVPYNYDYTNEAYDGVFISNGPGDPKHCTETIRILKKAFTKQKPIFGICLGTQLMALAAGATTYKLPFGHRSHNQPCMDLNSKRCYLTSQNHSYAVDEKTIPTDWRVSFRNLNDQSIEGIEHQELPFFAVQFHPEASPGPMDTQWLFQKFYDLICYYNEKMRHAI
ncbi:MAG: carbamoyl phosphate synthase small subunit [Gammaproteobacteria bacterium RIFCSPHIGHO2_12_FULL_37_14]|nr:MAG: carbamoyl phosphate synthase small subunit [Gammaproteobacteria bacterium RIFCSPHIGHO2_12_FULL_37_14]